MYKIIFNMISPVAIIDRPIFDSIIAYCYYMDICNKQKIVKYRQLYIPENERFDYELPFLKENDYYLTSIMYYDRNIQSTDFWCKRWDNKNDKLADFDNKKRKIRITAGQFKSYKMPLIYMNVKKCWFYFESNKLDKIQYFIDNYLIGLGKKVSIGYGWFDNYKVIETDEKDFKKELMRPIPKHQTKLQGIDKYCAYKIPYWLSDNMELCKYPDIL